MYTESDRLEASATSDPQKPRASLLSGHFRTGAAVGEVAVTEDEGSRSSQPIALVEWRYSGLFLMPLGIVWGNASRCHQQQGENISPRLSVLEIDIVLAHLNSPVDTEQAHRLVRRGRIMSPDRPEVLKLHRKSS